MDEKLPEWLEQCLTEDDRQLIGIVGTEAFLRLIDTYGGGNVYIPKNDRFERYARNKAIVAEFDGYNFRELAQKYHLTEMQIRVIVKDKAAAGSEGEACGRTDEPVRRAGRTEHRQVNHFAKGLYLSDFTNRDVLWLQKP